MKAASVVLSAVLLAGCGGTSGTLRMSGAGATFPAVIYQKWFDVYHQLHPDIQINYQAIGSGGGIAQLTGGTVDFGASDMPMTMDQIAKMNIKPLHFPTVLGGVVPTYNIQGIAGALKFTPETLSGIYLGSIKTWSDSRLKKDNPAAKLPDAPIIVVHRSDASGTSFVFTDYLSKVSPEWKTRVGSNTSVSWPVGLGGKGNEGVSGIVKQTPNSIGYVELIYAVQNQLPYGEVQNSAGNFVKADFNTVTNAAAGAAANMPDDFRVSITNAPGENAYPISTFTWLLIPSQITDPAKAKAMRGFLQWMLADGQKFAAPLSYAPLPQQVVQKALAQVGQVR
jgi:phosphate transport system substrate-binding protein